MMNARDFDMKYLGPLLPVTFVQISKCIESPNYQVGERGLTMWNSDFIRWLCAELRESIFPIIAPALLRNISNHWSENIRSLSEDVMDVFKDIDPHLWQDIESKLPAQLGPALMEKPAVIEQRRLNYDRIRNLATKN